MLANFLGRTVNVQRQVLRDVGPTVEVRDPKYGSARNVHVPDRLTTTLSAHVARKGITDGAAWMFPGREGNPVHQHSVGYPLVRGCGLCADLRAGVTL